jgi:SAM-dependent methyltransferase
MIESGRYQFVLSCHSLEHIANPLKAIKEWLRIVGPAGLILLVLPNKECNFDHNRQITSFDHLLDDLQKDVPESDLSHLCEILTLHDLALDPETGNQNEFKDRSLKNYHYRCLHHHVYNMQLLEQVFEYFNVELVLSQTSIAEYVLLGKKVTE